MRRSFGVVFCFVLACSSEGTSDDASQDGAAGGGGAGFTVAGAAASGAAAIGGTASASGGANGVSGSSGANGVSGSSGASGTGGGASSGVSGSSGTAGAAPAGNGGVAGEVGSGGAANPGSGGGAAGASGRGGPGGGGRTGGAAGSAGAGVPGSAGTSGAGNACAGRITYTLARSASPSAQQTMAYERITSAMNRAVEIYNCNTNFQKTLNVSYNPDVPTADGNPNGSMRFGSMDSMNYITAMHEISHTLGIGGNEMDRMVMNGIFPGEAATAQLRAISGVSTDQVHADMQHFWPHGLNYTSEVKSDMDLLNHCKMVIAIRKDLGL